jgi:tetratricopeptide (TPR) repeat protein
VSRPSGSTLIATVSSIVLLSRIDTSAWRPAPPTVSDPLMVVATRGRTNSDTYTDALDALTTAYSFMGDVQGALTSVRKERGVHERLGRAGTFTHVKTLFMEATFLNRGGQRREALARSDEVEAFAAARRLPPDYLHYMYRGIILMGVGRPADARALFEACARQFASEQIRAEEVQALTWLADALVQLGDVRAARARLEGAWPDIEAQIAEGNASMTKGLRVQAQVLQTEGRTAEARKSIDRAVAIIDASGSKIPPDAPQLREARAFDATFPASPEAPGEKPRGLGKIPHSPRALIAILPKKPEKARDSRAVRKLP